VVKAEVAAAAVKIRRTRFGSLRRALRGLADSALASLTGLLFGAALMWAFGYDAFYGTPFQATSTRELKAATIEGSHRPKPHISP
jgi:hypothetical protein